MSDDGLTEAIWSTVDDRAMRWRPFREDCSHIARVAESTLRAQIAAEIEAAAASRSDRAQAQRDASIATTNSRMKASHLATALAFHNVATGLFDAAHIARGNTPDPTPCDCGIECACATNRKDTP